MNRFAAVTLLPMAFGARLLLAQGAAEPAKMRTGQGIAFVDPASFSPALTPGSPEALALMRSAGAGLLLSVPLEKRDGEFQYTDDRQVIRKGGSTTIARGAVYVLDYSKIHVGVVDPFEFFFGFPKTSEPFGEARNARPGRAGSPGADDEAKLTAFSLRRNAAAVLGKSCVLYAAPACDLTAEATRFLDANADTEDQGLSTQCASMPTAYVRMSKLAEAQRVRPQTPKNPPEARQRGHSLLEKRARKAIQELGPSAGLGLVLDLDAMGGLAVEGSLDLTSRVTAALPNPMDQARIDYEAAKMALQQNKAAVALEQLESVNAVLGNLPELLVLMAQANEALGKDAEAGRLVNWAMQSKDEEFRRSESFKLAVQLAAKLQLKEEFAPESRGDAHSLARSAAPEGQGDTHSKIGLRVEDLTAKGRRYYRIDASTTGVVVIGVEKSSPAGDAGLVEGDVIAEVNGHKVSHAGDVMQIFHEAKKGDYLRFYIQRFVPKPFTFFAIVKVDD